jgi:hypothetical protein
MFLEIMNADSSLDALQIKNDFGLMSSKDEQKEAP